MDLGIIIALGGRKLNKALVMHYLSKAEAEPTIDSYVHDSANLFLDGIWNAGTGAHSDTLTAWVDLSGRCQPTPIGAGNTVEENCVKSNGTNDGRMTVPDVAPVELPQLTLELVFRKDTDNINNQVIAGRDYTKSYYVNTSKGSLSCWVGKSSNTIGNIILETDEIYSFQLTHTGSTLNLFLNGQKLINGKASTILADTAKLNLFGYVGNNTTFEGSLFAVRIHNRALTDEEVKRNYEIDKQRFGITDVTVTAVQESELHTDEI